MFLSSPDKSTLRQGDILEGFYYPTFRCSAIRLIGKPDSPQSSIQPLKLTAQEEKQKMTGLIEVQGTFAIVLSQCCDVQVNAQGKPDIPSLVLAPLVDTPYMIRTDPQKLANLKLNSSIHYVNLFHIPQTPPLQREYAVDFNRVYSVHSGDFKYALTGKVLQMTDEARVRFKIKLGLHFSRPTPEEIQANLYPSE